MESNKSVHTGRYSSIGFIWPQPLATHLCLVGLLDYIFRTTKRVRFSFGFEYRDPASRWRILVPNCPAYPR